jgi:two-component system sensor histidine kinase MtrB
VRYLDSPDQPGLVVGALLPLGADVAYEVYYLFPYGELQGTLDLVRSTAWFAGILLVALLALIMLLIARHVVLPVRQAARAAELLRAGHLEQRLAVKGEDDLAALALAFNDMAASSADPDPAAGEPLAAAAAIRLRRVARIAHPADHRAHGL